MSMNEQNKTKDEKREKKNIVSNGTWITHILLKWTAPIAFTLSILHANPLREILLWQCATLIEWVETK